jgi:hypothetical protein
MSAIAIRSSSPARVSHTVAAAVGAVLVASSDRPARRDPRALSSSWLIGR